MEHKIKRCLSLILLAFAGSMLIVSMTTDSWWQQAIPKRPKDISKSVIYRWKSLTEDCLFFPPIIPVAKCSVLKQEGKYEEIKTFLFLIPYRTKLRRTKFSSDKIFRLTKFSSILEIFVTFVRRKWKFRIFSKISAMGT